jgi:hypothetical protein
VARRSKTKVEWYLCLKFRSDGRDRIKRYKEKSQEKANADAQWYLKHEKYEDVWIERQEIPPAERIEVVTDGHED